MYADPISVTINTVAKSMPRISSGAPGVPSAFKTTDDAYSVEVSHQNVSGRRERHLIRLNTKKVAADPLNPALNVESKSAVYLVLDNPIVGFTDGELGYLIQGLIDFLDDSGNKTKFIGGEA